MIRLFGRKPTAPKSDLWHEVESRLDGLQAYARSHGGRIELVEVTDAGEVRVKMSGACGGCPLSDVTLRDGIETLLKAELPTVVRVVRV